MFYVFVLLLFINIDATAPALTKMHGPAGSLAIVAFFTTFLVKKINNPCLVSSGRVCDCNGSLN
jgi:hypothetical protein